MNLSPQLASEWHPTKNGCSPEAVAAFSSKKAWWIGKCGHTWEAIIAVRSQGSGCPICCGQKVFRGVNDVATTHPEVVKHWHSSNQILPTEVTAKSRKKVLWNCDCGEVWATTVFQKVMGVNCKCKRVKSTRTLTKGVNDLATVSPEDAAEWHSTLNSKTPSEIHAGSSQYAWWICTKGHAWKTSPQLKVKKKFGCYYCSGRKVLAGFNDLLTLNPSVAHLWHPAKNGHLQPDRVSAVSNKKIWWLGECTHAWQATVTSMNKSAATGNSGCPFCSNKKLLTGFNDLATHSSPLAKEWHPTKNGTMTPQDITFGSKNKVWWMCENGHEWTYEVGGRFHRGDGCQQCWTPGSKEEDLVREYVLPESEPSPLPLLFLSRKIIHVDGLQEENIFEYDGSYWHKKTIKRDRKKTLILLENGYRVFRVRNNLPSLAISHPNYNEIIIQDLTAESLTKVEKAAKLFFSS